MSTITIGNPFLLETIESSRKPLVTQRHRRRRTHDPITKKINLIVSLLHINHIHSKRKLVSKLPEITVLLKRKGVFGNSERENVKLFAKAVKAYSKIQEISITFGESEHLLFKETLIGDEDGASSVSISPELPDGSSERDSSSFPSSLRKKILSHTPIEDECFHRIVHSYDRLELAKGELADRSDILMNIIKTEDAPEVLRLIVGRGDTALALWIEEHPELHKKPISEEALPAVLMIGKDPGSWRSDYTLAQRHAMLERLRAPYQAADFVTQESYDENRHVNARHLYQANQCNLADMHAPVLNTEIEEIESFEMDKFDAAYPWEKPDCKYRARIQTPAGIKYIYTKKIDICAGLGGATNPLLAPVQVGGVRLPPPLTKEEFDKLTQFDSEKGCTPLIDGNEYVLCDIESRSREGRSIIVYGGGGTAAACGRKAFHGDDLEGEEKTFTKKDAKNSVLWIARNNFEKSGTGTLASRALRGLEKLEGLTLLRVDNREERLHLIFSQTTTEGTIIYEFDCDQLIYSTGQTDDHLHPLLKNITNKPEPLFVKVEAESDPVLVGAEAGPDVRLLGAAADAAITRKFDEGTWKFLQSTHVGGDVGPGSMPPTTAQLRLLKATEEKKLHIVNLNIDHPSVIGRFLYEAGAPPRVIQNFIEAMILARESSKPKGFSIDVTKRLISSHHLDAYVDLDGHASLVVKDI
jgi:hypothetical protein